MSQGDAQTFPYTLLDVFTDNPLAGNPLAVVHDGEGLSDEKMQALAAEFNLSETVFVFPPQDPKNTARIRIFTPTRELPFAGHPTVGCAVLLAKQELGEVTAPTDVPVTLEENLGVVHLGVVVKSDRLGHATFTLPETAHEGTSVVSRAYLADALGIDEKDIGFEQHEPRVFSAGNAFTFVPVKNTDVLSRIKPHAQAWDRAFGGETTGSAYIYTRSGTADKYTYQARMFWITHSLSEDPATGSAVAALAGALLTFEKLQDDHHAFLIQQGYEMGRPSQIRLEIDVEEGKIFSTRVGGSAIVVAEGTLTL